MTDQDLIRQAVERRREARRSIYLRGLIKSGPEGLEIPCTVHDLTSQGAGLSVASTFGLPRAFRLTLDGEHDDRYCRVMWIDEKRLGVQFK
jgi:hypothetical protein